MVTTKLGSSDRRPGTAPALVTSCKVYAGELAVGLFLLGAGCAGLLGGQHWGMATYLLVQGELRAAALVDVWVFLAIEQWGGGEGAFLRRPLIESFARRPPALTARRPAARAPAAGCVFLSFGFNLVDCNALLGGRLDVGLVDLSAEGRASRRAGRGAVARAATIPVIQLRSHEQLPLTRAALSAKSAPALASLPRLAAAAAPGAELAVLHLPPPPRADSPSGSSPGSGSGSGARTPDSFRDSDSSAGSSVNSAPPAAAALAAAKLAAGGDARWPSPTSSLANIYVAAAPPAAAAAAGAGAGGARKGWRFALAGAGYQSDHSD